ncbi:vomeronasal type-2 receptor 26-like [Rhinoderma darwinii]|uniref:vomeronasal type-2 receptor 26-like n=1 Tax=Rhinoderma darwinii TaxID=43563 RepID=UPI003F6707C7
MDLTGQPVTLTTHAMLAEMENLQSCPLLRNYAAYVTFLFAIIEINKDPKLLPNITLGYHIFDAYGDEMKSVQSVLQMLSGVEMETPNYSCMEHGEVAGFVGYSFIMEQILQIYDYTKINYDVTDKLLNNNGFMNSLFTMAPDNHLHHLAIVLCIKYFGWNWVGIITAEDESAEAEVRELSKVMTRHGICIEFIVKFVLDKINNVKSHLIIERSRAEVIIVCGQFSTIYQVLLNLFDAKKTLILNDSWFMHPLMGVYYMKLVNCSLSFSPITKPLPKLWNFIRNLNKFRDPTDPFLAAISDFYCLKYFIRSVNFIDHNGQIISFDETRRLRFPPDMLLANWVFQYNQTILIYESNNKSYFRPSDNLPEDQWLHVTDDKLTWKTGKVPQSRCNERCSPGYRKAPNGGYHSCCYDCVLCSEGEMSNISDSEICQQCPMDEWPNPGKTKCVPKLYEFLSYEEDKIAKFFCFTVIICCAITCQTLRKFILYWDTPLMKANNRTLSFILLVSILLSFLSVFLFLGRPLDITCKLRQTSFGIFFSIAISSLLAKSTMVCIAFNATKPSSSWIKWTGVRLSNSIVLVSSSVQVLICVCWLSMCPPYQEFDMTTYPGKIIIQCNEGSDIWFYSMLGYMGFLAAVSFVLAFMVRTLPDSFNEAKYITFSMLVFCSVWIAMIPAYLSTKGKYMVAVEIFAILTSSAGILSCIFFPKLYILLVKPEVNIRKHLLRGMKNI